MPSAPSSRSVACPRCGVRVAWVAENNFRPFCSERCRKIDLGAWAAGEYRVAGAAVPEGADQGSDQEA